MLTILLIQICDPDNHSIVLYLDLSDLLVFLAKAKQECTKTRVTGVLHRNVAAAQQCSSGTATGNPMFYLHQRVALHSYAGKLKLCQNV